MQSEDMDIQIYIASNGMAFEKVDKDMVVALFLDARVDNAVPCVLSSAWPSGCQGLMACRLW